MGRVNMRASMAGERSVAEYLSVKNNYYRLLISDSLQRCHD